MWIGISFWNSIYFILIELFYSNILTKCVSSEHFKGIFWIFYKLLIELMSYHLILLAGLLFFVKVCICVEVAINVTSVYTFTQNILRAEVTVLNGEEFTFVLFTNGTISKLDNQLQFVSLLSTLDNKLIVDF